MPSNLESSRQNWLLTAGGRIACNRCTAHSSRTGQQCGRPALKTSATQKCQFHGGRSTGPKTTEGRRRIADARTVHGNETTALRASRAQASCRLAELEDSLHVLGMVPPDIHRTPGRKPAGYRPVNSLEDVLRRWLNRSRD